MKKKIANSFKHILTAAGKNWMEAMRYYSLQMVSTLTFKYSTRDMFAKHIPCFFVGVE